MNFYTDRLIDTIQDKNGISYRLLHKLENGMHLYLIKKDRITAGYANIAVGKNYMDDVYLFFDFQGIRLGAALYNAVEQHLEIRLRPSPESLSDEARTFWMKRLTLI